MENPDYFEAVLKESSEVPKGIIESKLNDGPRWDCARQLSLQLGAERIIHRLAKMVCRLQSRKKGYALLPGDLC